MKKFFSNNADDIFFWLGALLISMGAWMIWRPLAFIVFGLFCLAFSYLIGRAKGRS